MTFYSLTLDINDRREHNLELYPREKDYRLQKPKTFVIDVPDFAGFKVLSAPLSAPVKCFVPQESDIQLQDCTTQVYRDGAKIYLQLEYKDKLSAPAPEPEVTKPIAPAEDISFDQIEELQEYDSRPPKKKTPSPVETPTVPELHTDLGNFNDVLQLAFTSNHYAYKLDALLLKSLSQEVFGTIQVEVVISLNVNGNVYENSIILAFSHPAEFLGIALDFGSESSQMAIKRYEAVPPYQELNPDNENLFRNILSYYKNKNWIPKEQTYDFYQEEKGTNFYKSLFFLKEKLTGDYKDFEKEYFIRNAHENLKMLVNTADGFHMLEEERFLQLPNLKILHKHERILEEFNFEAEKNNYSYTVKLREIKHKAYNSILEMMIVSFLKKEFIRYDDVKRNVRMMLLVPNNYDTKDINRTQQYLNIIFESLSQREDFKGRLVAWEILTISESDASFIGYINKHNTNIQQNKDYIIIDAGKGTTDFSIIRTGKTNLFNLQPIYRNGFTGSGNLLTYAIFETLLHYIREQNPHHGADVMYIKNRIIDELQGNNLEYRNKFYNEIERLKFNFKPKEYEKAVRENWQQAYDGDVNFSKLVDGNYQIGAVTNLLSKVNGISDFYGYIENACHFIVNNVVSYLKIIKTNKEDLSISGVILTGRSFRFQMLAQMMKQKLHQDLNIPMDKIVLLQGNELKDICIRGVFNNAIKLNAELTGYPIQIVYKQAQDVPKSEITQAKVKVPWSKRVFDFFINDQANLDKVESMVSVQDEVDYQLLQRSQFLIGCKRYNIRGDEFFHPQPGKRFTASIDFTQKGFVMRRMLNNKVDYIALLTEIDEGGSEDKSLVIPSLFPNFIDEEYLQSVQLAEVSRGNANTNDVEFYPSNTQKPRDNNPLFF